MNCYLPLSDMVLFCTCFSPVVFPHFHPLSYSFIPPPYSHFSCSCIFLPFLRSFSPLYFSPLRHRSHCPDPSTHTLLCPPSLSLIFSSGISGSSVSSWGCLLRLRCCNDVAGCKLPPRASCQPRGRGRGLRRLTSPPEVWSKCLGGGCKGFFEVWI